MKKYFLIAIFTFIMTVNYKYSHAGGLPNCFFTGSPKIYFYTTFGKLEYDFTKSTEEIMRISTGEYKENILTVGLATRRLKAPLFLKMRSSRYGKGFCASPSEVHVYIGFKNPKIYVSSQWEKDSCDYLLTLRHEEAHMQTSIRMLKQFIKHAPDRLKKASIHIKPLYVKDQSEANRAYDILLKEYSALTSAMTTLLEEEIEKEQKKIDDDKFLGLNNEVCEKHRNKKI